MEEKKMKVSVIGSLSPLPGGYSAGFDDLQAEALKGMIHLFNPN
ncbi:hypothetical protein [Paenibacillus typhae]|nr:hypothetical protein [Paenibacillus typhae]